MINFQQLVNVVFPFSIQNECKPRDTILCLYQLLQTLVSLSADIFLHCYSPWLYILNAFTQSHDNADLFSNAVHVYVSSISANFDHVFEVFQGIFFLPVIEKRCAGVKDAPKT